MRASAAPLLTSVTVHPPKRHETYGAGKSIS